MYLCNNNGQLEIEISEQNKLDKWITSCQTLHFNCLKVDNKIVQTVLNAYKSIYNINYIYNKLKYFYWMKCETEDEFNKIINSRLKIVDNLEDLLK